ncbi:MAG: T9SS type A sorting domain-containing protein [Saprospiraceae bacterium]|nr:T9SS type A sorting domain-containing protein [Saprospiraceae bacterium]
MKYINNIILLIILSWSTTLMAQERYFDEIFDNVKVTSDITYATNITVITGAPAPQELKLDIYEPEGDPVTARPLIIMFHSGNFLPYPVNQSTNGTKTDNAVVSMAERLAKMGYVVASATYRLGWNPLASSQAERVSLLINAAYRGVQDANTSVRFFKKTADVDGNPYKIDPDRIVLWGFGTGGYISMNTAVLDVYEKTLIPKFIGVDTSGNPRPMVISQISGDPQGAVTAPINIANHAGYSSSFQLSVNLGGAIGDTSWIDPGMVPMISYQVPTDPFAPYTEGIVIVPGVNLPVVEVQGSYLVQQLANAYGNNDAFVAANLDDVYTQTADSRNDGYEGLFPFLTSFPLDSAPWDWWDATNINNANGLMTNPDMSFAKAMLYADSIIGYFAPRAYVVLNLATSVDETILPDAELKAMPNPAHSEILVATTSAEPIREITLMDVNGKVVKSYRNVDNQYFTVHRNDLSAGVYMLHARLDKGVITKKIIFQ